MNSITGRIVLYTLAGLAAGFLTWFFSDLSGFVHLTDSVVITSAADTRAQYEVGMVWGASVGILLGIADLLQTGSWGQWPKALGFGLAVGLVAGILGLAIGMMLFGAFYVPSTGPNPLYFLRNVLARAIGWAAIGAMAGTADGWRKASVRVGRNGFIGGLIGGLLGGSAFEIIPYLMPGLRASPTSRLFGFLITGACIGLFVALVQQLFKEAWIRVVLGRNEGKEYLVEKVETRIGRSELADVPLFGDPAVAKIHALLVAQPGGKFVLRDVSNTPAGVVVNDERVQGERPVRDGDQIRIANRLLVFRERLTRTRTAPASKDVPGGPRQPWGAGASLPGGSAFGTGAESPRPRPTAPTTVEGPAPTLQGERSQVMAPPLPSNGMSSVSAGTGTTSSAMRLIVVAGTDAGASYSLTPGATITIGRDPAGAEIALPTDSKISRNHARLQMSANGRWAVEDLGSTNGTYVNGMRVTRQELIRGDTLLVGTTALRLE